MNTPGRYRGRVKSQAFGQNENTGNYQIALSFELIGKYDNQGQLEPCDPQIRTVWRVITDNTAERIGQELYALGFEGTSFAQVDRDKAEEAGVEFIDLEGVEADLTMRMDTYNGQARDRWDLAVLGGLGASAGKPVERKQIREVDAKFGKWLKAAAKNAPSATKTKPVAAGVGTADNSPEDGADIPF